MRRQAIIGALLLVGVGLNVGSGATAPLKRIVGTHKAEILRGTAKADLIEGRAGNDVLYGLAGDDRLVGGAGADRIYCGPGRDTVIADRRDTVAPDCEVVRGGPAPRPAPPPAPVVPEQLLGTWNRNITDGSVLGDDHRGVWSLEFDSRFVLVVVEPIGAHEPGVRDNFTTSFKATASGNLVIAAGNGCPTEGTYRWEIADSLLRIEKVSDDCSLRVAVLAGDWAR